MPYENSNYHSYKNHTFLDKITKKSFKLYMKLLDKMTKKWIWVLFVKNNIFLDLFWQKFKLLPTTSHIMMATLLRCYYFWYSRQGQISGWYVWRWLIWFFINIYWLIHTRIVDNQMATSKSPGRFRLLKSFMICEWVKVESNVINFLRYFLWDGIKIGI